MQQVTGQSAIGHFRVHIANGRTKTEWEWAQEVADKVIFIADTAPPPIRDQAQAFRDEIRRVVAHNIAAAVQEERAACAMLASANGAHEIALAIGER